MKLKVTDYIEASNEEIAKEFVNMTHVEQAKFFKEIEKAILSECLGDLDSAAEGLGNFNRALKEQGVTAFVADPENFKP